MSGSIRQRHERGVFAGLFVGRGLAQLPVISHARDGIGSALTINRARAATCGDLILCQSIGLTVGLIWARHGYFSLTRRDVQ